jgi:hypothetical protein
MLQDTEIRSNAWIFKAIYPHVEKEEMDVKSYKLRNWIAEWHSVLCLRISSHILI